jgi:hypothetical protein
MKITEITVTKGVTKNLGDYNSVKAEITLTATVEDSEDAAFLTKELFNSASRIVAIEVGESPPDKTADVLADERATDEPARETKTGKWNKLAAEANKEMVADDTKEIKEEAKVDLTDPETETKAETEAPLDRGDFNKELVTLVKRLGAAKVMGACPKFGVAKVGDLPEDQRRAFLASVVS